MKSCCPLLMIAPDSPTAECWGERCAWWCSGTRRCAILELVSGVPDVEKLKEEPPTKQPVRRFGIKPLVADERGSK